MVNVFDLGMAVLVACPWNEAAWGTQESLGSTLVSSHERESSHVDLDSSSIGNTTQCVSIYGLQRSGTSLSESCTGNCNMSRCGMPYLIDTPSWKHFRMGDGTKEDGTCDVRTVDVPKYLATMENGKGQAVDTKRLKICKVEDLETRIRKEADSSDYKFLFLIKSPLWWLASNCRYYRYVCDTLHWEGKLGEAIANDWNEQAQAYLRMAGCARGTLCVGDSAHAIIGKNKKVAILRYDKDLLSDPEAALEAVAEHLVLELNCMKSQGAMIRNKRFPTVTQSPGRTWETENSHVVDAPMNYPTFPWPEDTGYSVAEAVKSFKDLCTYLDHQTLVSLGYTSDCDTENWTNLQVKLLGKLFSHFTGTFLPHTPPRNPVAASKKFLSKEIKSAGAVSLADNFRERSGREVPLDPPNDDTSGEELQLAALYLEAHDDKNMFLGRRMLHLAHRSETS